jgi:2-methylcitrate dehydratase PrpD
VVAQARRCLLDLIGVAAAGAAPSPRGSRAATPSTSSCGATAARASSSTVAAPGSRARRSRAPRDRCVDAHDGHPLTKGHAGVAVLPALLAFATATAAVRVSTAASSSRARARLRDRHAGGIALHGASPTIHCSGAWNALAAAAIGARLLRLDARAARTRSASRSTSARAARSCASAITRRW